MTLEALRDQIDALDDELCALLTKRMEVVRQIALLKRTSGLPLKSAAREEAIIRRLEEKTGDETAGYIRPLYMALFDASRAYQEGILSANS